MILSIPNQSAWHRFGHAVWWLNSQIYLYPRCIELLVGSRSCSSYQTVGNVNVDSRIGMYASRHVVCTKRFSSVPMMRGTPLIRYKPVVLAKIIAAKKWITELKEIMAWEISEWRSQRRNYFMPLGMLSVFVSQKLQLLYMNENNHILILTRVTIAKHTMQAHRPCITDISELVLLPM